VINRRSRAPANIIWSLALLLLAAACLAYSSGYVAAHNSANNSDVPPKQPYGDYLAGLHAVIHSDLRAAAEFHEKALALDPDNKMILKKAFMVFISDGRYDLAKKVADKLAELNVSDSMVQMFLFLEKAKSKEYDAALLALDKLGNAGVYGLFKPLFKSWILLAQGKSVEAETTINTLLKTKGFKGFKQFHAGLFYDFTGKSQLAEDLYSTSLIVPGAMSLRIVEAYGELLRRLGRAKDARQLYVNYLEKAPDNAILKQALYDVDHDAPAAFFIKSENDAMAEIFYSAANFLMQDDVRTPATVYLRFANYMKPDFYLADFLLGQIFEVEKYFDGALEQFDHISQKHPLYIIARLQMAWTYEKMGQLDKAIDVMTKLSVEFPDNSKILSSLGDIYRMHNHFKEAETYYSQYIGNLKTLEEKNWSIFYTRGIVYEQDNKWALAEADFLKALELHPDQPQVLNYLAYSWVDKGKNIKKAQKMLERAAELRPYDGYIIDSLGWAMYRIGDMTKAVEYLEKAVLLQTDDWAINDHLGDAYWAVGRKYEAKFQWRHALSLKPDEALVAKIRSKIRDGKK